jgi:hypothetical protein
LELIYEEVLHEEECWPSPEDLPHPKVLYDKFYQELASVSTNLVCGSCGCIFHNLSEISSVPMSSPFLNHLHVPRNEVEFSYSSVNPFLDSRELMIDPLSVDSDGLNLYICHSCLLGLQSGKQPIESLANYRWINPSQPHELQDLTWLEERLVARGYLSAMILRLEKRAMNHYGLKGHVIVLPQETTQLTNLLPRVPATLAASIKVVWAGRGNIDRSELTSHFTVNKFRVYNALIWLCSNHADYKDVQVDRRQFELWPPVFVVDELISNVGTTTDTTSDAESHSGFATEDLDSPMMTGNLPFTASAIIDTNCVTQRSDVHTLYELASLRMRPLGEESVDSLQSMSSESSPFINVVLGSQIKDHTNDSEYFTSCFPTLFPYGNAKHIDHRRGSSQLSLPNWIKLLLRNSSRYVRFRYFAY